ncbi:MAG: hypothetical protein ABI134_21905 [Byssovorax sp.]
MKRVLLIGLLPSAVDFSSLASSAFPDLTPEKLFLGIQAQEKGLRDLGFELTNCLVDAGETAEAVTLAALQARAYDVVVIGAGVRTLPAHFLLFERLLNLVHEHAPKARICFNTRPEDTQAAVLRWVDARGISG